VKAALRRAINPGATMPRSRLALLSLLVACTKATPPESFDDDEKAPDDDAQDVAVYPQVVTVSEIPAAPAEPESSSRDAFVPRSGALMLERKREDAPAKSMVYGEGQGATGGDLAVMGTIDGGRQKSAAPATIAPKPPKDVEEATHGGEEYTDAGVNPMTLVTKDALSTFSIDVDTASYSIMRKKILGGELPAWEGVRAEEFVNYFDYDYTPPRVDPFTVSMEAMPDPFRAGHHILRVGVQGKEVSEAERPDVHLVFLVDTSGSMSSQDKLPLAQRSLHLLVDRLRETDTVALCTYAGNVAKILDPTPASDRQKIHRAIQALSSGGSTAMSSGIDLAYGLADAGFEKGAENRVIILSDGDANVGTASWEDMLAQIKGYADKGITLTTVGFGVGNYRDTLMEQLANNGDGTNVYIDDPTQAERVFVDQVSGTLVTIARDVKIQVEMNPESVESYRLIGYENRDIADRDFRNDRVDAGEVGSGHNVTALYDVVLKDGYSRQLATVRLRYEKPGADGTAAEKSWKFEDTALAETPELASRATRIAYTAGTFAEVLRHSQYADGISLTALEKFARASARPKNADDQELAELIHRAGTLGRAVAATE
jgi:Ca-activated chloride channel family protein